MRPPFVICFCVAMSLPAAADAERRCGWYSSPTPGNLILTDRDGERWIQMQGRPDPKGIDNAPAFDDRQFVKTNVPGGLRLRMRLRDRLDQRQVTKDHQSDLGRIPLAQCRNDRSLPNPG
jgi:hypothetical protein